MIFRLVRACIVLALLSALSSAPLRAEPLEVVASFSILADMAREIGGRRVNVTALIGADEDAHGYRPRPSDARRVKDADLVIANGLGFDSWFERMAASAGTRHPLLIASTGITPLETGGTHDDHGHHAHGNDEHDHGDDGDSRRDPHAWQDVANARRYAANIAAALSRIDPAGADEYRVNAMRYDEKLRSLDTEIRDALSAIPAERRKCVMSHDALAYFGHAYGLRTLAASGLGSETEPSAAAIALLIRQLRGERVPVVFIENISDPRIIRRIADESGARIGGKLYTDALSGADGPAATYLRMMRHNVETLLAGLSPQSGE